MRIAVATDSNSGIKNMENGIFVLPMPFLIDGEEFFEGVNLTVEDFFKKQMSGSDILTSQPNIYNLQTFWSNILNKYDAIVYIPMSGSLSASVETAKTIAKYYEYNGKVFVVDNRRISLSQKQSAYDAVTLVKEGKNPEEIVKYLEDTAAENSIYIMVPDLKYLKKGGRITKTAALIGTLLKIKPVLQIQGGKLDSYAKVLTVKKARETMIGAIKKDLETRFKKEFEEGRINISVAYTFDRNIAEDFKAEIESSLNAKVDWIEPLSLSISCHIGPNSVAVALSTIYNND